MDQNWMQSLKNAGISMVLTTAQVKVLEQVNSVAAEVASCREASNGTRHNDDDMTYKVRLIQENLEKIIKILKLGTSSKRTFLRIYPKFKKNRQEVITNLEEIEAELNKHRFNCNVSRLVGYCTSLVGGTMMIASAVTIPLTMGLTMPLVAVGGSLTAAGASTAVGASITESVLQNGYEKKAKEIIKKDNEYFQKLNEWLEHSEELQNIQADIMNLDIAKDIAASVKKLTNKALSMKDEYTRYSYLKTGLQTIFDMVVPQAVVVALPLQALSALIVVLVAIYLLLQNAENRLVFDCASFTIRSLVGIAALADDTVDVARFTQLFTGNSALANNVAKAVVRGAVAAVGITFDIAGIILTAVDVHNGSLSPVAEKIHAACEEYTEQAELLENIYENLS